MKIVSFERLGFRRTTSLYICEHPTWGKLAIFKKPADSVFRDGNSFYEAVTEGTMCWMMEDNIAHSLSSYHGVETVIFYTDGVDDMYVSKMEDWTDPAKLYERKNPNTEFRRGGTFMRYLPFQHFRLSPSRQTLVVR